MSFFWSRFSALPDNPDHFLSPPAFFYRLPVLETEDLVLRRPLRKDARDIFRYASDEQVARYVLWDLTVPSLIQNCLSATFEAGSGQDIRLPGLSRSAVPEQ